MVGFEAACGCWGLAKQDSENAPGNPHDTLTVADTDAELDDGMLRVPSSIRWEAEEHGSFGCPANVLMRMLRDDLRGRVFCSLQLRSRQIDRYENPLSKCQQKRAA